MRKDDYGYFGKGIDGYVHYMQAKAESEKGGGGGNRPSSGKGCLSSIIFVLSLSSVVIHGIYELCC